MPNYCVNKLTVEYMSDELKTYLQENGLSFNKIKPCEETCNAQVSAWGTKWDLDEQDQREVADSLIESGIAEFDTAWSPPTVVLKELSRMFPNDEFRLVYVESGMVFCGETDFNGGEECENVFIDGPGEDYDTFIEEEMGWEPFEV